MAFLTIPDEAPSKQIAVGGTPSTGPFTFDFSFFSETDDIAVMVDDTSLLSSAFTVTGNAGTEGGYDGGQVVLDTAVSSVTVTIYLDVPRERLTNLPEAGIFDIPSLNTMLNKIFAMLSIDEWRIDRSLHLPPSAGASFDFELPDPDGNANTVLTINGTEDGISLVNPFNPGTLNVSPWIETNLLPAATQALARAALGASAVGDDNTWTGSNTFSGILKYPDARAATLDNTDVDGSNYLTLGDDGWLYPYSGSSGLSGVYSVSSTGGTLIAIQFTAASPPQVTHHATNLILANSENWTPEQYDVLFLMDNTTDGSDKWIEIGRMSQAPSVGAILQYVEDSDDTYTNLGAAVIPLASGTTPLCNEGVEVLTLNITPKRADTYLEIDVGVNCYSNGPSGYKVVTAALFKDPVGDGSVAAVAKDMNQQTTTYDNIRTLRIHHRIAASVAGVAQNFTVRIGTESTPTAVYINGVTDNGPLNQTYLRVREVPPPIY